MSFVRMKKKRRRKKKWWYVFITGVSVEVRQLIRLSVIGFLFLFFKATNLYKQTVYHQSTITLMFLFGYALKTILGRSSNSLIFTTFCCMFLLFNPFIRIYYIAYLLNFEFIINIFYNLWLFC